MHTPLAPTRAGPARTRPRPGTAEGANAAGLRLGQLNNHRSRINLNNFKLNPLQLELEKLDGRDLKNSSKTLPKFPLSCPRAAPPRRGGAIGRSSIVATLEWKSLVYCAFPLTSCQPRLRVGTRPGGLGETQAVTGANLNMILKL